MSIKVRIAIVENEQSDIDILLKTLNEYFKDKSYSFDVNVFTSGSEIVNSNDFNYDIFFLDILMPGLNGMEVAKLIRKSNESTQLIFVTNMINYAIKGYEVKAFDYILKPINKLHLFSTLDKVLDYLKTNAEKQVLLKNKSKVLVVPLSNIKYISIDGHLITYHFSDGTEFECWGNLSEEQAKLGEWVIRVNQNVLINCKRISSIDKKEVFIDNVPFKISRSYQKEAYQKIMDYYRRQV